MTGIGAGAGLAGGSFAAATIVRSFSIPGDAEFVEELGDIRRAVVAMHGERVRKRLPLAVRQAVDRRRLESRAIRFLRGVAIERMAARQHFIAEAGEPEDVVALVGLARGNAERVSSG